MSVRRVTFDRLRNWRVLPTLRVAEVSAVVGISQREVRRMVKRGELERDPKPRPLLIRTASVVERFDPPALTPKRRESVRRAAATFLREVEAR